MVSLSNTFQTVRGWCAQARAFLAVDCSVPRSSTAPEAWRGWDIKCSTDDELFAVAAPRVRTVELERATVACSEAAAVLTACAERAPATAALGASAGRVAVASLQSFDGGGYGNSIEGIDSDPSILRDLLVGMPAGDRTNTTILSHLFPSSRLTKAGWGSTAGVVRDLPWPAR